MTFLAKLWLYECLDRHEGRVHDFVVGQRFGERELFGLREAGFDCVCS